MNKIAPYAKSIVAALIAGLASLQQALDGDNNVSTSEWVAVAVATLAALGVVFAVPNKDPDAVHQDESVQPPGVKPYHEPNAGGETTLVMVVVVVLVVLLLLFLFGAFR